MVTKFYSYSSTILYLLDLKLVYYFHISFVTHVVRWKVRHLCTLYDLGPSLHQGQWATISSCDPFSYLYGRVFPTHVKLVGEATCNHEVTMSYTEIMVHERCGIIGK